MFVLTKPLPFQMKDIIDSLKLRLNSPFIVSFIISWPFWNWEIMVALLWYDSDKIKIDTEWQTYFQLVNHYATKWRSLFAPLLSAITYTFGYPLIKWGISSFNAWIGTKEETNVLELTKTGSIPTTKYIETLNKNKEQIATLSEIIKQEGAYIEEINALKVKISTFEADLMTARDEINKAKEIIEDNTTKSSQYQLVGKWFIKIYDTKSNAVHEGEFEISSTLIVIESTPFETPVAKIASFVYNPSTSYLSIAFSLINFEILNKVFKTDKLVFTEAMWINDNIESTNRNVSGFTLRMIRSETK